MSAFLVSSETIHRAVYFLRQQNPAARAITATALGRETLKLNARALRHLYTPDQVQEAWGDPESEAERYAHQIPSERQLIPCFKALECWDYQCCEGDVPGDPLFQLQRQIAVAFENSHPGMHGTETYKTAAWDA
ncbi:MAG: hypothetical protein AAGK37_19275 [Pseudomonadota bacterium]